MLELATPARRIGQRWSEPSADADEYADGQGDALCPWLYTLGAAQDLGFDNARHDMAAALLE